MFKNELPDEIGDDKLFVFKFNSNGFNCNVVVSEEQKDFMVDYCKRHPKQNCYGSDDDEDTLVDSGIVKSVKCGEFVNCFYPITRKEAEELVYRNMCKCSVYWSCVFEDNEEDCNKWCELCEKYGMDWDW